MLRIFGIKKKDNITTFNKSICKKLDIDINLVNCSNQAIERKIKKINTNDLNICVNIYKFIL